MTHATRVWKEARQLAWPWTLTMFMSLLLLFPMEWQGWRPREAMEFITAFILLPLLAMYPMGSEFHQRTLSLLLSQPMGRRELWRLKSVVAAVAVLTSGLMFFLVESGRSRLGSGGSLLVLGGLIVFTVASAMYWVLAARSAIGALALNYFTIGLAAFTLGKLVGWETLQGQFFAESPKPEVIAGLLVAVTGASAFMLWLGRRKLMAFQAVEGASSGLGEAWLAKLLPALVGRWLRSQPTTPVLNLVRRECHLLRQVWPLTALAVASWIFLVSAGMVPAQRSSEVPLLVLTVILSVLIASLAGTLSVGEEKNWGTLSWQMTLPISSTTQWAAKLGMALFTGVICGAILPSSVLLIAGWMQGSPFHLLNRPLLLLWIAEAAGITLVGFWCACVVKGTLRSLLWLFPVLLGLGFAVRTGVLATELLFHQLRYKIDVVILALNPFRLGRGFVALSTFFSFEEMIAIAVTPVVGLAMVQSLRLLRRETEDTKLHLLRSLAPALILVCVFAAAGAGFVEVAIRVWEQERGILVDIHRGIERLQPSGEVKMHVPNAVSGQQLASTSALSPMTQRFLGDSTILVAPSSEESASARRSRKFHSGDFSLFVPGTTDQQAIPYSATIAVRSGASCEMTFRTFPGTEAPGKSANGVLAGSCN